MRTPLLQRRGQRLADLGLGRLAPDHAVLNRDRAIDGIDRAAELDQRAGELDHAPVVFGDQRFRQFDPQTIRGKNGSIAAKIGVATQQSGAPVSGHELRQTAIYGCINARA